VLVSLDGFGWDFGRYAPTPHLDALAARGVRAERLIPAFPSKTFPNHYTLVTGLHPGHHGVVGNTMRDARLGRFSLDDRRAVGDGRWWGGEPLWATLQRQGGTSAPLFWPGSEAEIGGRRPTFWRRWSEWLPIAERPDWLRDRLREMPADRPRFVTLYVEAVDAAAHDHPLGSPAVARAVASADRAVGQLLDVLSELGLAQSADVVVLSDHGHVGIAPERTVFVDELVDLDALDVVDWSPLFAANPRPGREAEARAALARSPHLSVYLREETPPEWHLRDSPRVPRLLALAEEGWSISTRAFRARNPGRVAGNHGFDPALPAMGALFVAAGPSFRRGVTVPPFENVHLYELFCRILGVAPAPNDGDLERVRSLLAERAAGAAPQERRARAASPGAPPPGAIP
jgi:predicted AlkP superfamily pyrophosphatase or phosphodiesterase